MNVSITLVSLFVDKIGDEPVVFEYLNPFAQKGGQEVIVGFEHTTSPRLSSKIIAMRAKR